MNPLPSIDQAFLMLQGLLNNGYALIEPVMWTWFGVGVGFAIFFAIFDFLAGQNPIGFITAFFLRLGIFVYLGSTWKIIIDSLGNMAVSIGHAVSGSQVAKDELMVPGQLFGVGNTEATKVMEAKAALCDSWRSCIVTLPDQIGLEVVAWTIWICFGVLVLMLIMAALTLKKHGLFAMLFLPLSQIKALSSLPEGAIAGIIQTLMWLAFISMVAGFGSQMFTLMQLPEQPVIADITPALLVAVFMAMMAWQSRSYAAGIVSGSLRVGGDAFTGAGRAALGWVTGGSSMSMRMASLAGGEKQRTLSAASDAAKLVGWRAQQAHAKLTSGAAPTRPQVGSGGGGSQPSARKDSAWNDEPTKKQAYAAEKTGVDISGMSRGQASVALETKGKMDPSWYKD